MVDNDGDGFSPPEDCDDSDPNVNPDAEEIKKNDIDDDCDGEVDEKKGCGCATPNAPAGGLFLLGLAGVLLRRR
ncbi:MAG: hypothetical protein H6737_19430 [Alphaproteobacteria bacterium]|nr:hypothetical protein [Alphaproteobacteria bacterium]